MNLMHLSYTCAICRCEWGEGVCLVVQTLIIDYCLKMSKDAFSTRTRNKQHALGLLYTASWLLVASSQPTAPLSGDVYTRSHTHHSCMYPHTQHPPCGHQPVLWCFPKLIAFICSGVCTARSRWRCLFTLSHLKTHRSLLGAFFFLSFLKEYVSVYLSIYCMCGTSVVVLCFRISDKT